MQGETIESAQVEADRPTAATQKPASEDGASEEPFVFFNRGLRKIQFIELCAGLDGAGSTSRREGECNTSNITSREIPF